MDAKTYVFGQDSNSSLLASLIPALQNKGVDTGMLMGMLGNNNRGGLFGNGNGIGDIIALVIVAALFGNGNGNGIFGGGNNNSTERDMLMSAIQRNGTDLSQLAQTIGCSTGRLQDAIGQVSTQICSLAGQNGLSFQQVINSIQAGNTTLAQQIADCCCENRLAICQQTNTLQQSINGVATGQERGFANIGFETQRQTCAIEKSIADSTAQILAGQRAAEMREMQNKIDALREENGTYKSSAMTSQIVGQAVAPINAALAGLQKEVDAIKCKQPETFNVPYQPFTAVPNCVAYQYGLYGGVPGVAGTGFFG